MEQTIKLAVIDQDKANPDDRIAVAPNVKYGDVASTEPTEMVMDLRDPDNKQKKAGRLEVSFQKLNMVKCASTANGAVLAIVADRITMPASVGTEASAIFTIRQNQPMEISKSTRKGQMPQSVNGVYQDIVTRMHKA